MHVKTKKIFFSTLIVFVFAMGFFILPLTPAFGQASLDLPGSFAGLSSQDLKTTIENIVRIILGFIGVIFLVLLLYGGVTWMTSGGDEKKISQAKKIITSAVIGLLITLSAYAIAGFVIRSFTGATGPGGPGGPGSGRPGGFGFALGAGALESHYPGRNARDIPRNTNMYITFKEAMNVSTLCDPDTTVNEVNVRILDLNNAVPADSNDVANDNTLEGVLCEPTDPSNTTFRFDPSAYLGTGNGNVVYQVVLGTGILTDDNEQALTFDYGWQFTVSSIVDLTPPTVVSTSPGKGETVARNSLVQINFSEPVDPTSASGLYAPSAVPPSLYELILLDTDDPPASEYLAGSYAIGNQYRTVEFVSNELCGVNSCGQNVYCLPGAMTIYGVVTSGIRDMSGNFLDQDAAPGNQPYEWQFLTTDAMDLDPPVMIGRSPQSSAIDWPLAAPIEIDFNEVLSISSLNTGNVGLGRTTPYYLPSDPLYGTETPIDTTEGNYWISSDSTMNLDLDSEPETRIYINHDIFVPLKKYHPGVDSEVRDLNQNCYFPAACSGSC